MQYSQHAGLRHRSQFNGNFLRENDVSLSIFSFSSVAGFLQIPFHVWDASDVWRIKTYYMVIECRKNYVFLFTWFICYSVYASFHVAMQ